MAQPAPFSAFEWLIAWRYLRARRREGGISVMTWISLVGITLAVFALIATLAVRSGFREEFTDTIIGANPHVTLHQFEAGRMVRSQNYASVAEDAAKLPGVSSAAPAVRAQVMASANDRNVGVELHGLPMSHMQATPRLVNPEVATGSLEALEEPWTIAVGSGVARELGLFVGDIVTITHLNGPFGPTGRMPEVQPYTVAYIFQVGRWDIDKVRIYLPLPAAQLLMNYGDEVDQIDVQLIAPETVGRRGNPDPVTQSLARLRDDVVPWTWKDSNGAFLQALQMEDNIMFVILSILVIIASLNITSGLVMLVKNKGRDVGILRTMGLSQWSVLRVFFICGALVGIVGTVFGMILGCLFAIYIDPIFSAVNYIAGGGVWDPSQRMLSSLPAKLLWPDVMKAVALSLGLSFLVTIFPARRAARLNPVEALRYE